MPAPGTMKANVVPLFTRPGLETTEVVDLGEFREVLAWVTLHMVDPTIQFDADNAVAADILLTDPGTGGGTLTEVRVFGGRHWGTAQGQTANLFQGAWHGFARRIQFRLRATQLPSAADDVVAHAEGIVLSWPAQ